MKIPEFLKKISDKKLLEPFLSGDVTEETSPRKRRLRGRGYTKPTYNFLKVKRRRKIANISRKINRRRR
jgi:hypothetical protein